VEKAHERILAWLFGSIAGTMLFAGVSILLAGVALFGMLSEPSALGAIAAIVLQLGAAFVVTGATAKYLSRRRGLLLPNERLTIPDDQRPPVSGWSSPGASRYAPHSPSCCWPLCRCWPFPCRVAPMSSENIAD